MRVDHIIGNATNAKRPRLRTRVLTNNTTTLQLRLRVNVLIARLRYLNCRITANGRNVDAITRVRLSPTRRPVTLDDHVSREKDNRRTNRFRHLTRIMNGTHPLIERHLLNNNNVITNHHARKTINRLNRTIAGTINNAHLILRNKDRTHRTINTRNNRIELNGRNVLAGTVNTVCPGNVNNDRHASAHCNTSRRNRTRCGEWYAVLRGVFPPWIGVFQGDMEV